MCMCVYCWVSLSRPQSEPSLQSPGCVWGLRDEEPWGLRDEETPADRCVVYMVCAHMTAQARWEFRGEVPSLFSRVLRVRGRSRRPLEGGPSRSKVPPVWLARFGQQSFLDAGGGCRWAATPNGLCATHCHPSRRGVVPFPPLSPSQHPSTWGERGGWGGPPTPFGIGPG